MKKPISWLLSSCLLLVLSTSASWAQGPVGGIIKGTTKQMLKTEGKAAFATPLLDQSAKSTIERMLPRTMVTGGANVIAGEINRTVRGMIPTNNPTEEFLLRGRDMQISSYESLQQPLSRELATPATKPQVSSMAAEPIATPPAKKPTAIVMTAIITDDTTPRLFKPTLTIEEAEKDALQKYTPDQLRDMAKQQEQLLERIDGGFLQARYNIGPKKVFYPYGQAMARAEVEGNLDMLSLLKKCEGVNDFYFSKEPARILGLTENKAEQVVAGIIEYVQETTALMYRGYSWGEKPINEVMIPSKYHSLVFEKRIEDMLSNSNSYFDKQWEIDMRKLGFSEEQIEYMRRHSNE